jgi:hypothetical protein
MGKIKHSGSDITVLFSLILSNFDNVQSVTLHQFKESIKRSEKGKT